MRSDRNTSDHGDSGDSGLLVIPGLEGEIFASDLFECLCAGLVVAYLPQRVGVSVDVSNAAGDFLIGIEHNHLLRCLGLCVEQALEGLQIVKLVLLGVEAPLVEDEHFFVVVRELRQRNYSLIVDALGKTPPFLQGSEITGAKIDNLMQAGDARGGNRVVREMVLMRNSLPLPELVADHGVVLFVLEVVDNLRQSVLLHCAAILLLKLIKPTAPVPAIIANKTTPIALGRIGRRMLEAGGKEGYVADNFCIYRIL